MMGYNALKVDVMEKLVIPDECADMERYWIAL